MDPFNARFQDRQDGGRALARRLGHHAGRRDVVVIGLPPGGVVTAAEVALQLIAPLDVLVTREVTVPQHEKLVMGAVGPEGARIIHHEVVRDLAISASELDHAMDRETAEQRRRERLLRGDRPRMDLAKKTLILVDDGIASGASMRSAIRAVRLLKPSRVIAAAPIIATVTLSMIQHEADEVVCVMTGDPLMAVANWYDYYDAVTDADVRFMIERHAELLAARPAIAPADAPFPRI